MNLKSYNTFNSIPLIKSYKVLKGNTKISVLFEIAFSVGSVLYNFYLSLYMKACGITDTQIGYIITIGFISGILCAFVGGEIINKMGRKRSTLIFEILAYPIPCLIYAFSNNFWMFALARVISGSQQISTVAWNFMIVEDATNEERAAAFNILTLLHTATGIITPLGGLIVAKWGVIKGERIFLILGFTILMIEMIVRNQYYRETQIGKEILKNHNKCTHFQTKSLFRGVEIIAKTPIILVAVSMNIGYNMFFYLASHFSLYLNVYISDYLGIDSAAVSITGGINSFGMCFAGLILVPLINQKIKSIESISRVVGVGIVIQMIFLILMIFMPQNNLKMVCIAVFIYAIGYSFTRTYIDTLLANTTECEAEYRGNIYATMNLLISIMSTILASFTGLLYASNPVSIFWIALIILGICFMASMILTCMRYRK